MVCVSHARAYYDPKELKATALWASSVIDTIKPNRILVCGKSGWIVGGLVSVETGIPLITVRKNGDILSAGKGHTVEYDDAIPEDVRWVFLDDLISTGATLLWCMKQMHLHLGAFFPCACVLHLKSCYEFRRMLPMQLVGGAIKYIREIPELHGYENYQIEVFNRPSD